MVKSNFECPVPVMPSGSMSTQKPYMYQRTSVRQIWDLRHVATLAVAGAITMNDSVHTVCCSEILRVFSLE
jgi:hypothetical protein